MSASKLPRVHGEHIWRRRFDSRAIQTPPRAWRTHLNSKSLEPCCPNSPACMENTKVSNCVLPFFPNSPACMENTSYSATRMLSFPKLPRVHGEHPSGINNKNQWLARSPKTYRGFKACSPICAVPVLSTLEVPRLNGLMTIHISRGVRPKGQVRTVFTLPSVDHIIVFLHGSICSSRH